ncbi:hypothetical protein VIBC2010_18009 [Vibrio caribbeanicus ATCC BAA-2122]|uniref:Uncharacterized protein n=1 Tax=Vibrio caribbeanicus ATCC BAA-2122 TaxID=796620 RepID=E3BHM6_9VIBR|nr:hypothetical protein VIBC2010_18009 [Vibrio caribbeanicus ATCC BAA-2122]
MFDELSLSWLITKQSGSKGVFCSCNGAAYA